LTPEELEALTQPGPLSSMPDPLLADIPAIADNVLALIDRLQHKPQIGPAIASSDQPEADHKVDFSDGLKIHCTHAGNGDRFIDWFGPIVRYCPAFDWWYIWNKDEGRWAKDEMGLIYELGKNTVKYLYLQAANAANSDRRKEIAAWAMKCETPGSVNQLLESARTDSFISVSPDIFDIDPFHINLKNGWLDLKRMIFHQHSKNKFFTMLIPVEYNPMAICPGWLRFLDRIFKSNPDKERIIDFLQRAVGYTLSGDTSERAIFLMHGLGANGKTVFIRVLEALFGEYGASVSSVTFTTAMSTNVRNDLARLNGKRFVWASENSSDTVLDEENIKRWTGGDTVVCRFLFKEEFTYRPAFKIWWIFNHKPKIRDATDSIWDRINLIPCNERIPIEEQDKKLTDKLLLELPGILNWALVGYKKFLVDGLKAPDSVKEATKEYRNDEDALFEFLETYFEIQKESEASSDWRVSFKDLYDIYKAWSVDQGFKTPWTKTKIGRILSDRFKQIKSDHGRTREYIGLRVKGQRSLGDRSG
jgi:putative DNA primase/helicase